MNENQVLSKSISRRRFLRRGCMSMMAVGMTVCGGAGLVAALRSDPPPIDFPSLSYGEQTGERLSIALLLVGGGLFPPVIGIVGGVVAMFIHASPRRGPGREPGPVSRFFAVLWPWPVIAFFTWLFGQFVIGYFFNDFLRESRFLIPLLILGLMALSIVSGFARDAQRAAGCASSAAVTN